MKRTARKVLALMLAIALCVTQLALPVMAETTTVTNPDGSTTTTTEESSNSSSADADGSTTTTDSSSSSSTTTSADGSASSTTSSSTTSSTTTSADGSATSTTTTSNNSSSSSSTSTGANGSTASTSSTASTTTDSSSSSSTASADGSQGSTTSSASSSSLDTKYESTTTSDAAGSSTITNTETKSSTNDSSQTQSYFPDGTSTQASGSGSTSSSSTEITEDVTNNVEMGTKTDDVTEGDGEGSASGTTTVPGTESDPIQTGTDNGFQKDESYSGEIDNTSVPVDMDFVGHTFEMKQSDIKEGQTSATYTATYTEDDVLRKVLPGEFFDTTTAADGTQQHQLKKSGAKVTLGTGEDAREWTMTYEPDSEGKVRDVTLTSPHIPTECYNVDADGNKTLKENGAKVTMTVNGVEQEWIMNYDASNPAGMTFTLNTGADKDGVIWNNDEDSKWENKEGSSETPAQMTEDDYNSLNIKPSYKNDSGASVELLAIDFKQTGTTTYTDADGNTVTRTVTSVDPNAAETKGVTYIVRDEIKLPSLTPDANGEIAGIGVNGPNNTPGTPETVVLTPAVKPQAFTQTANDMTTVQTVEEFKDAYGFPAYRSTMVVTDNITGATYTESHEYFATVQTTTETTVETPATGERTLVVETKVLNANKTSQEIERQTDTGTKTTVKFLDTQECRIVDVEGEMFMEYEGQLFKVEASTGRGYNGKNTTNTFAPSSEIDVPATGRLDGYYQLLGAKVPGVSLNDAPNASPSNEHAWALSENALISQYLVQYGADGVARDYARQYVLKNANGDTVYAYCIDKNVHAVDDADYDMDNVIGSGYTDSTASMQIEYAALNGYWGTDSGTGSLANVKQLLSDNAADYGLTADDISKLSHGAALAATQAALWALSNDNGIVDIDYMEKNNIIAMDWAKADNPVDMETVHKLANSLFKILIDENKAQDFSTKNQTVELLDEDNFATEVNLTVKDKVTTLEQIEDFAGAYSHNDISTTNTEEEVKDVPSTINYYENAKLNDDGVYVIEETDENNNTIERELYMTDMDFVVDVDVSTLTKNTILRVVDSDGKTIAKRQIATEDSNFFGKLIAGETKTTYTFKDLILPNGMTVSLTIDGVQEMAEGAYLYSAAGGRNASQTFVGIASGEHEVHLSVDMKFTVSDPGAEVAVTGEKERWVDTDTYKKTQSGVHSEFSVETDTTATLTTKVLGTKVQTRTVTKKAQENWKWNSYAEYLLTTISDEDGAPGGGAGAGGGAALNGGLTIPDEAVPLAAAPKTGDVSQILAIVCLISLSGAYALSRKQKQF